MKFKHILSTLIIGGTALGFTGCADEDFVGSASKPMPWEEEGALFIPLGVSFDAIDAATRATGDTIWGSAPENDVDFGIENECFAIFFNEDNQVKFIKELFLSEQLTKLHDSSGDLGERTYMTVAYVKAEDVDASKDNHLTHVLVVLNGGKIYNTIKNQITEGVTTSDVVMSLTWDVSQDDDTQHIGMNSNNHYTMSNSAYYQADQLMTLTPLNNVTYYSSIDDYIANNGTPAAKIYVERMVAKFSEPSLSTEVIGSDRFFRPSDDVRKLVVYRWEDDNTLTSDELDWRIHLLGWTINGEETSSFIFKNIPNPYGNIRIPDWDFGLWNNASQKRSYWSIDPHYNTGFYPWQYRKAADRSDIISYSAAVSNGTSQYNPALKYYHFNDISWQESITAPENTIDPTKQNWNLDSREDLLAGPHLLITAEIYLQGQEGGNYLPGFGPVGDFYADRNQRYFIEEKEIFKLFVTEFNHMLSTQEQISFNVFNWDNPDTKVNVSYITKPTGECRLYYNDELLTFDVIDRIFADQGHPVHLYSANIRQGDGRVIPWIPGMNVKRPDGMPLVFEKKNASDQDVSNSGQWTDNMYRSLFAEWFGAIDHYSGGKMYYAGAIKHHNIKEENKTPYIGTVRNHWYKFTVESINSLGTPIDDVTQRIIPDRYKYNDQVSVYIEVIDWHLKETDIYFTN